MTKQIDLILWNRRLFSWLVVPLVLGTLFGMGAIWVVALHQAGGKWGGILLVLPPMIGCIYGLERLTSRPAQVLISDKGLAVKYVAATSDFEVDWADAAFFKDAKLNGGRELQLRTHAGGRLELAVSTTRMNGYFELVRAVRQAVADYNAKHSAGFSGSEPTAIAEREEFWESRVGIWLLALLCLLPLLFMLLKCSR